MDTELIVNAINSLLQLLTDDERLDVFSNYCRNCGTTNLPCSCSRDD